MPGSREGTVAEKNSDLLVMVRSVCAAVRRENVKAIPRTKVPDCGAASMATWSREAGQSRRAPASSLTARATGSSLKRDPDGVRERRLARVGSSTKRRWTGELTGAHALLVVRGAGSMSVETELCRHVRSCGVGGAP